MQYIFVGSEHILENRMCTWSRLKRVMRIAFAQRERSERYIVTIFTVAHRRVPGPWTYTPVSKVFQAISL